MVREIASAMDDNGWTGLKQWHLDVSRLKQYTKDKHNTGLGG